jgi:hypothetical protein
MTITDSRPAKARPMPASTSPDASTSPAATLRPTPTEISPQGTQTTGGQTGFDAHGSPAAGSNVPDPAAIVGTAPTLRSLLDPALSLAADILDDLERVRVANENRLRQLTRTAVDSDGEERGFGLDESHPDVARLAAMVATLKAVEHDAVLNLQHKLRKHPLGAWVKAQRGIGEKQGARLLAAIADPYINSAKGAPRTVSALWAYCGLHVLPVGQSSYGAQSAAADRNQLPAGQSSLDAPSDDAGGGQHGDPGQKGSDTHGVTAGVAAKRRKGERANWSGNAKMRAYLVAQSCMKQLDTDCRDGHGSNDAQFWSAVPACPCSPYRVTYDMRRAHTAVTHPEWTDGHSHNDALRIAAKAILRDLWRAARDYHVAPSPAPPAPPRAGAGASLPSTSPTASDG